MPAQRGLIGRCLRERRVVLVGDVTQEPDYAATPATRDVRSELDVPVMRRRPTRGARSSVQSTEPDAFDEGDASMLALGRRTSSRPACASAPLRERLERA